MKYQIQINNGNANLGVTQKTVTVNEVNQTVDENFLAHYMHLHNGLIPEDAARAVLSIFGECAAELMAQGHAIQLKKGDDVLMRIYPDIHLQGGNINIERARELTGNPALTEAEMVEQASELVRLAGVTYRARCEAEQKFTALLKKQDVSVQKVDGIKQVAFVPASDGSSNGGSGQGGGSSEGGENGGNGGGENAGGGIE